MKFTEGIIIISFGFKLIANRDICRAAVPLLQQTALKTWANSMDNLDLVKKVFNHRAKMNGLSTNGQWSEDLEKVA